MKAVAFYKYGPPDILKTIETERPEPKESEVLIKVHAASVNAYDWHLLEAKPFFTRFLSGLLTPKNHILGADMAGVVVALGYGATKFSVGNEVFGCLEGCGKGGLATGAFAEYVCVKETNLSLKSSALTFEEAAALPMASVTALQAVRDYAKIRQGQSVLINGASGGVGLFAVQIAKAFGAKVTGVCSSESVETVHSLGVDIIDYKKESVVNHGNQYDAVIDVAATLSVKDYRYLLKSNGICVVIGFSTIGHTLSYSLAGKRDGKRILLCMANNKSATDLLEVSELVDKGKVKVIIDSRYSLDHAADALRMAETGHPKGKVIISVTSF